MSGVLQRAVDLARTALAFSRVERITRHEDGVRPETDSDHTVMLALVALDLLPEGLDAGLVALFAVVHDLPEVHAGDTQTLAIDAAGLQAKRERERRAVERLRWQLGDGALLVQALEQYEAQVVPEARYVRVIDKLVVKLTHLLNGCVAAQQHVDLPGLQQRHAVQLAELTAEHQGDAWAGPVLELLQVAMLHAEAAWTPVLACPVCHRAPHAADCASLVAVFEREERRPHPSDVGYEAQHERRVLDAVQALGLPHVLTVMRGDGHDPDEAWRRAVERALGVQPDPVDHDPAWAHRLVLGVRELGNGVAPEAVVQLLAGLPLAGGHYVTVRRDELADLRDDADRWREARKKRRRSRCFSYGETRTQCVRYGQALVTLADYKTACGQWLPGDEVGEAPDPAGKRPKGVCPRCWAEWRRAFAEQQAGTFSEAWQALAGDTPTSVTS